MGEHSTLGNLSLLMKGEKLPENTSWSGCPAQYIQVQYYDKPPHSIQKSVERLQDIIINFQGSSLMTMWKRPYPSTIGYGPGGR